MSRLAAPRFCSVYTESLWNLRFHVEEFGAHQMPVFIGRDGIDALEQRREIAGVLIPHGKRYFGNAQIALFEQCLGLLQSYFLQVLQRRLPRCQPKAPVE